jgi:hypothetical protein
MMLQPGGIWMYVIDQTDCKNEHFLLDIPVFLSPQRLFRLRPFPSSMHST